MYLDPDKLVWMKQVIEMCRAEPEILHTPQLSFCKEFLLSFGATIPEPNCEKSHCKRPPSNDGGDHSDHEEPYAVHDDMPDDDSDGQEDQERETRIQNKENRIQTVERIQADEKRIQSEETEENKTDTEETRIEAEVTATETEVNQEPTIYPKVVVISDAPSTESSDTGLLLEATGDHKVETTPMAYDKVPQNGIMDKKHIGDKSVSELPEEPEDVSDDKVTPTGKTCNVCGRTFRYETWLKKHLKQHSGLSGESESDVSSPTEEKKPKVCPVCGKEFIYVNSLKKHLISHIDPTTAESESNVSQIRQRAEPASGDDDKPMKDEVKHRRKNRKCDVCGKAFRYENCLKKHRKSHSECEEEEIPNKSTTDENVGRKLRGKAQKRKFTMRLKASNRKKKKVPTATLR